MIERDVGEVMEGLTEQQNVDEENSLRRCDGRLAIYPTPTSRLQLPNGHSLSETEVVVGKDDGNLEISSVSAFWNDCEQESVILFHETELSQMEEEQDASSGSEQELARNELDIDVKTGEPTGFVTLNACEEESCKIKYLRGDLEALRYVDVEEQQKKWNIVYQGLGLAVKQEFDQLVAGEHHNDTRKSTNRRQNKRKNKKAAINSGEVSFQNMSSNFDEAKSMEDFSCSALVVGEASVVAEEACYNDDNSNDEYDGILKPAFLVEGEPDFESGPPQDGLEYLRRVRWEAAQCPKVKVVKLNKNKLDKEQTTYMPTIPEIAKCPGHLLPSKKWEDAFLADFSHLRQVLAQLEDDNYEHSAMLDTFSRADSGKDHDIQQLPKDFPTVSAVLAMDAVSRASMLRSRISAFETADVLSKADCLWLFALCAAVDIPLNAEMGASIRGLLRKCATLRAQKSEMDDEAVMLNLLVTIAGRYFGQSDGT